MKTGSWLGGGGRGKVGGSLLVLDVLVCLLHQKKLSLDTRKFA